MSLAAALDRAPKRTVVAPPPAPAPVVHVAPSLRDYQDDFVVKVRVEYRNGTQAVLLVSGTGSGKTVVFSYIARQASAKGNRVLILAHRDQLIKQASRKLRDNGVDHGIIMAGFTPNMRRLVQVASVQTLVRRIEKLIAASWAPDLIVIDEAHLSSAASYLKIIEACLKANPDCKTLGVTGSPIRLDGKGLGKHAGGLFQVLVQGITIKQLIARGYLVKPEYYGSEESIDLSGVKKVGGDYDSESLAALMDKPKITGSAIEQYKKHCYGVPGVAWCANVAHAEHVAAEFNANGIPALALSGESSSEERDAALAKLSNGTLKIITFAMLLVEGVDCPAIGAVILLRPTMSLSSYLQVIGRGLRPIYADGMPLDTDEQRFAAIDAGPKGRICFVLDHCDLWRKHGFAHHDREWSLDGVVKKKGKKKKDEETVDLSQCPKCFHVFEPAMVCPHCGHVMEKKARKLEHTDGNLTKITDDMAEEAKRQKQVERKREIAGCKSLDELKAYAAKMGYSAQWANHVFNARKKRFG